jgi:hypothetical protein
MQGGNGKVYGPYVKKKPPVAEKVAKYCDLQCAPLEKRPKKRRPRDDGSRQPFSPNLRQPVFQLMSTSLMPLFSKS